MAGTSRILWNFIKRPKLQKFALSKVEKNPQIFQKIELFFGNV